ncbi:MAG: LacI family DNA-binding transcriptional regulator [bacterium]
MPTLSQLAEQLGLSVSVVSRALNDRPDRHARVAPATRERIRATALRLGWQRNRVAEALKRGCTPDLGVFLPPKADRLIADLVIGMAEVAEPARLPLGITFDHGTDAYRRFFTRNAHEPRSGLITYPYLYSSAELSNLARAYRREGGAIVLLNADTREPGVPVVEIDEAAGGRLAARHLLARGCRQLAVAGQFRSRATAFHAAAAAAGTAVTFVGKNDEVKGQEPALIQLAGKISRWLAAGKKPVGVFAVNDRLALRLIRLALARGIAVGTELLVIGFDDLELAADITPALTTLHQPFRDLGRVAVTTLMQLLEGGHPAPVTRLPPRLIVRETA